MDPEAELTAVEEQPIPAYLKVITDTRGTDQVDLNQLPRPTEDFQPTVRNVLGFLGLDLAGNAQVFVNNAIAGLDTPVREGDKMYVAGKLAGGA